MKAFVAGGLPFLSNTSKGIKKKHEFNMRKQMTVTCTTADPLVGEIQGHIQSAHVCSVTLTFVKDSSGIISAAGISSYIAPMNRERTEYYGSSIIYCNRILSPAPLS